LHGAAQSSALPSAIARYGLLHAGIWHDSKASRLELAVQAQIGTGWCGAAFEKRGFLWFAVDISMKLSSFASLTRSRELELRGDHALRAVAWMIAALFAGSTILTPLYVVYKQQFGFSQITLTLIYAVYIVGNLIALFLFGRLSDEIGRRRPALVAMTIVIVSALCFLFARGTVALYVGRILSGLAICIGAGTGTAWLAELIADENKSRPTVIATSANFAGLGVGALIAGVLAQFAPFPLRLTFVIYLVALAAVTALVRITHETVAQPAHGGHLPTRPRLSVPREIRAQFVAPAITGFGAMALVGFYAAVSPSILAEQLHETSHAIAGALFFELAMVVAGTIVVLQNFSSRAATLCALALMLPSVALVVWAQTAGSLAILVIATALCGVAAGLGYRGSLQVVNQIAPADRRAEVVSSYFVCGFCGNALPVIGIGVIATLASATEASIAFAVMISVFALVALYFGAKYRGA
jgi:MFS family permease